MPDAPTRQDPDVGASREAPATAGERRLPEAPPAVRGSRFAAAHQRRAHLHPLHPVRLWRLLLGLGLLAFGIINVFIPGPGGSVIILSALLVLAGESSRLARLLDSLEVRFAPEVDWALRHKLAAIVLASTLAFLSLTVLGFAWTQLR